MTEPGEKWRAAVAANAAQMSIVFEAHHLRFPSDGDYSIEDWLHTGRTLADMTSSIPFWVGDWLNYGEAHYGETYSQGLTLWDYGYQSLANMAYVARQYPPETRTGLSWTHHRYAASLPLEERTGLLERAVEEEWTSRQLQIEVAKAKLNDKGEGEEIVAWTRFTVEVSTTKGEIRRTANNINQHLIQINELAQKGLIDRPAVKYLGRCQEEFSERDIGRKP